MIILLYNMYCNTCKSQSEVSQSTNAHDSNFSALKIMSMPWSIKHATHNKRRQQFTKVPFFLFRTTEGAESILFREKFCDWPEPGRIIKMKGHVSSGEVMVSQELNVHVLNVSQQHPIMSKVACI